jgi:hypothetical protein
VKVKLPFQAALAALLAVTPIKGIAAEEPCVFPATATTAASPAVTASNQGDLAVQYATASVSGPLPATIPAGDSVEILQLVPPQVWGTVYVTRIAAVLDRQQMNKIGMAWFAQVRYPSGKLLWIAGPGSLNAPSLGGRMPNKPTCELRGI